MQKEQVTMIAPGYDIACGDLSSSLLELERVISLPRYQRTSEGGWDWVEANRRTLSEAQLFYTPARPGLVSLASSSWSTTRNEFDKEIKREW